MSYSFGMFFKQCENKEEAYETARKVTGLCLDHSKEIIENSKYYIPSIRLGGSEKEARRYAHSANQGWLYSLINMRFVYWEEYRLLGFVGYNYPKEIKVLFDTHQTFQNGTDQNYEFDEWDDKICIFSELKEKCQNMSAKEILEYYLSNNEDWYTEEEIEEDLDYYRKSTLYNMVMDALDLDDWLYGRESEKFFRFTMNAINCQEDEFKVWLELEKILEQIKKEEEEFQKKGQGNEEQEEDGE